MPPIWRPAARCPAPFQRGVSPAGPSLRRPFLWAAERGWIFPSSFLRYVCSSRFLYPSENLRPEGNEVLPSSPGIMEVFIWLFE